ncbi:hypothetical protein LY76DRAFT_301589 [Colletotrichum caudatum]|nr:hypothetical protein LY76DRAFT_301589 [Colletotrichum caudatum]
MTRGWLVVVVVVVVAVAVGCVHFSSFSTWFLDMAVHISFLVGCCSPTMQLQVRLLLSPVDTHGEGWRCNFNLNTVLRNKR